VGEEERRNAVRWRQGACCRRPTMQDKKPRWRANGPQNAEQVSAACVIAQMAFELRTFAG
jgi:hypothetical protein